MSNRSLAWALSLLTLLVGSAGSAYALQEKDVTDGARVEAIVSLKDPTRIRVDGAQITVVFGNIYSSNCGATAAPTLQSGAPAAPPPSAVNPAGEVLLECDADKGEIYVRPVSSPTGVAGRQGGDSAGGKPISLFVSTKFGTYTLLLHRSDVPADTIVLRDRTVQAAAMDRDAGSLGRQAPHVLGLKAMLVAMTASRLPSDVQMQPVNREVPLWLEARFVLEKTYTRRGYLGERYRLTNVSNADMVLAEQEFDREGDDVLAVSVENHNLRPGDSTAVYVIRRGS
jgi:conjugal transfer pilus assembly protein TraK